jgi:hypothetical protein
MRALPPGGVAKYDPEVPAEPIILRHLLSDESELSNSLVVKNHELDESSTSGEGLLEAVTEEAAILALLERDELSLSVDSRLDGSAPEALSSVDLSKLRSITSWVVNVLSLLSTNSKDFPPH